GRILTRLNVFDIAIEIEVLLELPSRGTSILGTIITSFDQLTNVTYTSATADPCGSGFFSGTKREEYIGVGDDTSQK
uniref:Uncharacterized protein n=1 Tax=Pristionchus pacificus TaxID=54126 RepID=A0A2A6CSP0_PRIPA